MGITLFAGNGCSVSKTQVAYTVYPIGYLINRIGGDYINAVSVQEDYDTVQVAQLKEDAQEILLNSGVFFHIGNIEPYLAIIEEFETDSSLKDYDLSGLNAIYKFARYTPVYDGNSIISYTESTYYQPEDAFSMVDVTTNDLNLWVSPISMLSMARDILEELCSIYPDMTNTFNDNFESLQNDLVQLDAKYQALANDLVDNNQEIKFVSMTASFGNWQKAYGIQVYPICLSKFGTMPTDEQLEYIKETIVANNVQYIVYEPNMSDEMLTLFQQLQEELGLTRVDLSNLSSLSATQSSANLDYLSIMYENLSALEVMATDRTTTSTTTSSETSSSTSESNTVSETITSDSSTVTSE